jgi:hypothetical protein
MRRLLQTSILITALAIASFGQTPASPPKVEVPIGEGAWAIHVTTGGGFTGKGRGEARITSEGRWFCQQTQTPCIKDVPSNKLAPLKTTVAAFNLKKNWSKGSESNVLPGTCIDCYTYQVTFSRREKGKVQTFTIAWDDTTRKTAPADIVQIVESALAGKW